jgi:HprK-related kinase B
MSVIDDVVNGGAAPHRLSLQLPELSLVLRSNHAGVVAAMRQVYSRYLQEPLEGPRYEVWALDLDPTPYLPADRSGFERYLGGGGQGKDPFLDVDGLRYVIKNSTGLGVIFDDQRYLVLGAMAKAANQLNNIINAIHLQEMSRRGDTTVHGAGLSLGGVGFALVGGPGAGKTTALLKIVAAGGAFVSNDRLIVRRLAKRGEFEMRGVIKSPRACAGTMFGDPRLRALLPAEAVARYAKMPEDELFVLEEKYDVDVDATFGEGRVKDLGRFRRMYCLMWSRRGEGFAIERIDATSDAFWDAFGPNLSRDGGVFDRRQRSSAWGAERKDRYRRGLDGMEVFAVTGRLDFDRIAGALQDHLRGAA